MRSSNGYTVNHEFSRHSSNGTINPAFEFDENPYKVEEGRKVTGHKERAKWGNGLEFLMSCISMSVGLGNLWRFPFVAYENGGGAFLIPYLITLFVIGRPLYYMDMFLGQFSSRGNVQMFRNLVPVSSGIAYGQLFACCNAMTYYCSVMALTLIYFINSCREVLPWTVCDPDWDPELNCVPVDGNKTYANSSIGKSSSELYLKKSILHEKDNIDDGIGAPDLQMTLYLFVAWLVVFFVVIKGVKSSGKYSYFLAMFPYVIMLTLLIRGVTLEGSLSGILFFIRPRWDKLFQPKVWYMAVTQCFFSLNVAAGPIVMFSSYNDFRHNINRDSVIVSVMDTITSFMAGCTIFAILGNLSHVLGQPLEKVVDRGPTLAFISYPNAIANFNVVPQLFAALFFIMLFILGIGSLVSMQGCLATVIKDEYPHLKNWWIAAGTCMLGFVVGLVYITPGGQFILTLVDNFAVTFIIYIMAVSEVIVVVWFYGLENMCLDMQFMLREKVSIYWRITWAIFTPMLLLIILIYSLATMETLKHNDIAFPSEILAIGWILFAFGVIQIPFWAGRALYKKRHLGLKQAIESIFSFENWGPQDPHKLKEWKEFKLQAKAERSAKCTNKFKYHLYTLIGKDF